VVHCPRSHYYFGHARFPLPSLIRARVNVCLGTDSLASVYKLRRETVQLDLFEEMRICAENYSAVPAKQIVCMATVNGARALGMAGQVGELSANAFADLIAIPFRGNVADSYEGVLHHKNDVAASMIDGK